MRQIVVVVPQNSKYLFVNVQVLPHFLPTDRGGRCGGSPGSRAHEHRPLRLLLVRLLSLNLQFLKLFLQLFPRKGQG